MPQQVGIELRSDVMERIAQIPSAVTPNEKSLALYYLSERWDGKGDVFENGPLLGGATRALALGMEFNKKRDPDSLLQTYDWFSIREALDLPPDVWSQLVQVELLTEDEVAQAHDEGSFLALFEALHEDEDYWPLIRAHVGYLPGHRDDVPEHGEAFFKAPDREFSVAFIDGCKSWYGTKYWFRELAPRLRPGSDLMFQDFGHYTCFWIPMLVGTFREHFELIAYVDHTYVWRLRDVPTEAEVELAYPDEPTCLDREAYDKVFDGLVKEAFDRGDRWGFMVHQAHRAAAYAYIGLLDESRAVLDGLLMTAEWRPVRSYLKQARVSPTYTPEGRIEL